MEDLLCLVARHPEPADLCPTVINEHLTERFGRGSAIREPQTSLPTSRLTMRVNQSIREYVRGAGKLGDPSHWLGFREVPVAKEVWNEAREGHEEPVEIEENLVVGPYPSRDDYLERHYRLLREDAIAPLRDAISEVQVCPYLMEKDSREGASIYEKAGPWSLRGLSSY